MVIVMTSNQFNIQQQPSRNHFLYIFFVFIINLLVSCFFCESMNENEFRENRKFFTRSVFNLHIEHLMLNLAKHLNKSNESTFTENCLQHININQCHIVLGICIAEIKYINHPNHHIPVNRPILIKHQDNLINAYSRAPSFSWEIYNDLLPVDCEIGHEQILTGLLSLNASINRVNLTYNVKLSTMIKHNVKLLFNVYHLTSNGDLWLVDQLSSVLYRVELNQPWTSIKLDELSHSISVEDVQQKFTDMTNSLTSSSTKNLSPSYFNISASYRYLCSLNYYGEHCNRYCKPRDSHLGHYQCHPQTGELICNSGWTGARCNQALCRKGCKHGTCIGSELCRCIDGWTGPNCDQCVTTPGCLNGHCQFSSKHTSYLPFTCECEPGWTGMLCNINMRICDNTEHVNICQNHGVCINQPDPNGLKVLYRCECLPGFYGTHCEKQINNCKYHGCNNRGECKKEGKCKCDPSYYGTFCQFNQTTCNQNPCLGNQSKCYTTSNKIIPITTTTTTTLINKQLNQTVKQFKCLCEQGKFGENCEYDLDECLLEPCQNGGQCVDLTTGYKCICPPRFTGSQCQFTLKACQNNSCSNGGECLDESISFQCHCLKGWKGVTCQENINECSEIPKQTGRSLCQNNAGCRDLLGSYKCLCSSQWEGKHCELYKVNQTQHQPNHYHQHFNDCQHDKDVNNSVSKNRMNHHLNEFLILFIILTIAFLIMIISLSGSILFFCTNYKHQKMKKLNNPSTCQPMLNTHLLRSIDNSTSETLKLNEHEISSTSSYQQFNYPIQHEKHISNRIKPIQNWPCLLYVNKLLSDKSDCYQNQKKSSLIETPQCYVEQNVYLNKNINMNSLLRLDNMPKVYWKDSSKQHLVYNQNNNYQHHHCNHHIHNNDNVTNQLISTSSLSFNKRLDTPPPTYEISVGLNTIVQK
ncbi:Protein jagged-1b [Schistosoma japonicum]|nr:Protein jagged-1b [Schistosoma japonicum]